jgi:hypothetical protein
MIFATSCVEKTNNASVMNVISQSQRSFSSDAWDKKQIEMRKDTWSRIESA